MRSACLGLVGDVFAGVDDKHPYDQIKGPFHPSGLFYSPSVAHSQANRRWRWLARPYQRGQRSVGTIFVGTAFVTARTTGLNGFAGVNSLGGLTGLGRVRFNVACVAGNGLIRLMPGWAFLSANHSPSRTASHSWNVILFIAYIGFGSPILEALGPLTTMAMPLRKRRRCKPLQGPDRNPEPQVFLFELFDC